MLPPPPPARLFTAHPHPHPHPRSVFLTQASQARRAEDEIFISNCKAHLNDMRESVQEALVTAVERSREQQRDLILAKGANRLAANGIVRLYDIFGTVSYSYDLLRPPLPPPPAPHTLAWCR